MDLGRKLAEGKTKEIYEHPADPRLAIMVHKDSISAGDGARRNVIEEKGAISGRTTANVFRLLNREGIRTHFVDDPDPQHMIVERCAMAPIEVVMRRIATGSFLRRNPEVAEGTRFDPVLVEFFFKDDAAHDPQISEAEMIERGLVSEAEVQTLINSGRLVFETLERAWAEMDVQLVDLKIEFGRNVDNTLVVADVIDNDSWRLWPGGDKERMLDKQVYRNMQEVTSDGLALVKDRYVLVRDLTERFR